MIFVADWVFPICEEPIRHGFVECDDDGVIISVGSLENVDISEDRRFEDQLIVYRKGFITPGFVNAHCHVELSHMEGLFRQGTGMDGFIQQINALRLTVDREGRIEAMRRQFDAMYEMGVSAMGDISNCDESFEMKREALEQGRMYTRTYLEVFGTEPEDAPAVMEGVIELQKKAREYGLDAAPTPHSCYTMSPELNRLSAVEGLKSGFISYHSQESDEEEDMIRFGTGALADDYHGRGASTPPLNKNGALCYFIDNLRKELHAPIDGHVLLVHNVALEEKGLQYALDAFKHPYWAICPLSNIFIHRALPPIEMMRRHGLKICIGTDSLSSNTLLSPVAEMKCLQDNFPEVPLSEVLTWACLNGAEAIGRDEVCGSIEEGKRPGLVLIENVDIDNMRLTRDSRSTRLI
jgi:Cytosine deaminase and related metal-dependent hydrolases